MDSFNLIRDRLSNALCLGTSKIHITIYIKDQVLFQIVPTKTLTDFGYNFKDINGFSELHFFNKNKTLTFDHHSKFINTSLAEEYFFFLRIQKIISII
jgi:hypothetical protein